MRRPATSSAPTCTGWARRTWTRCATCSSAARCTTAAGREQVPSSGAIRNTVMTLADGIVGRGVLLDVPGALGRPYLERRPRHHRRRSSRRPSARTASPWDPATSCSSPPAATPAAPRPRGQLNPFAPGLAGLHPECLRWIAQREVAVLGSDGISDLLPPRPGHWSFPVHQIGIVGMGLHLIDNVRLDTLAARLPGRGPVRVPVHRRTAAHPRRHRQPDQPGGGAVTLAAGGRTSAPADRLRRAAGARRRRPARQGPVAARAARASGSATRWRARTTAPSPGWPPRAPPPSPSWPSCSTSSCPPSPGGYGCSRTAGWSSASRAPTGAPPTCGSPPRAGRCSSALEKGWRRDAQRGRRRLGPGGRRAFHRAVRPFRRRLRAYAAAVPTAAGRQAGGRQGATPATRPRPGDRDGTDPRCLTC